MTLRSFALAVAAALVAGVALSACGSSTPPTTTSTSTTSTTVASTSATRDLVLTPAVRTALLDAGAGEHSLVRADYLRLAPKTAYYAYDGSTHTYYAAAGLVPNPHSMKALVAAQDDGGYNLFVRAAASTRWTVYNDGLGAAEGAICPVRLPASVLAVWNWTSHSCYPPFS